MADEIVTLETIANQQLLVLEEMRLMRRDAVHSFRQILDNLLSMHRSVAALDRRLSSVKDGLEATIRMELTAQDATDEKVDARLLGIVRELEEIFDRRYVRKEPE